LCLYFILLHFINLLEDIGLLQSYQILTEGDSIMDSMYLNAFARHSIPDTETLSYLLDRARWSSPNHAIAHCQWGFVIGIMHWGNYWFKLSLFNWTIHLGVLHQYTTTWYLWSIIFEHFEAWRTGNLSRIHKSSLRRTKPIYWTQSSVLLSTVTWNCFID